MVAGFPDDRERHQRFPGVALLGLGISVCSYDAANLRVNDSGYR